MTMEFDWTLFFGASLLALTSFLILNNKRRQPVKIKRDRTRR